MKKYKLIKKYPFLPKSWDIGFEIVNKNSCNNNTYHYAPTEDNMSPCDLKFYEIALTTIIIENNPEFWEEIIEKDYEILKSCPIEGTIYSIKRLSDGEVFTIGDTVDYIHKSHYSPWKIDNFFITKSSLLVRSGSNLICEFISDLKHVKLFVTLDNKEIFVNDHFYYIGDAWNCCKTKCLFVGDGNFIKYKTFYSKEKAEQYIKENKPQYSFKDMLNFGKYVGAVLNFTNPEKLLINWNLNHKNE